MCILNSGTTRLVISSMFYIAMHLSIPPLSNPLGVEIVDKKVVPGSSG